MIGGGTFYKLSLCKRKGTFTLWVPISVPFSVHSAPLGPQKPRSVLCPRSSISGHASQTASTRYHEIQKGLGFHDRHNSRKILTCYHIWLIPLLDDCQCHSLWAIFFPFLSCLGRGWGGGQCHSLLAIVISISFFFSCFFLTIKSFMPLLLWTRWIVSIELVPNGTSK